MRDDPFSTVVADVPAVRRPVLCLHTATLPPLGADTWVHLQIIGQLDRRTHAVHVACAPGSSSSPTPTYRALSRFDDIEVIPVDLGPELYDRTGIRKVMGVVRTLPAVVGLARLALLIRRRQIRVIHTSDRPRDAAAAVLLARLTGARSIVHVHVAQGEWIGRLLRWSIRRADHVVAISEFVATTLESTGVDRDRIEVVLNAIDPAWWHPGEGRDEARSELGLPLDAPVLVTVSRLFREKGTAELVRALALVRADHPDVRLVVVGSDASPDGLFMAELDQLVAAEGLDDSVSFIGRRDDVPRILAAADVFAMPSFEEPFGLVFLEAMAMQLPVVALANGGTLEVVKHGLTGLLSEHGDVAGLAHDIDRLLRDPSLRARLGAAGRARVEAQFTVARQVSEIAELYARIERRS